MANSEPSLRDIVGVHQPTGNRNKLVYDVATTILDTVEEVTMPSMMNAQFKSMGFKHYTKQDMTNFNQSFSNYLNPRPKKGTANMAGGDRGRSIYHRAVRGGGYDACAQFLRDGKNGLLTGKAGSFFALFLSESSSHPNKKSSVSGGGRRGRRLGSLSDKILNRNAPPTPPTTTPPAPPAPQPAAPGPSAMESHIRQQMERQQLSAAPPLPTLNPNKDLVRQTRQLQQAYNKKLQTMSGRVSGAERALRSNALQQRGEKLALFEQQQQLNKKLSANVSALQQAHAMEVKNLKQRLAQERASKVETAKQVDALKSNYEAQIQQEKQVQQKLRTVMDSEIKKKTASERAALVHNVKGLQQAQQIMNKERKTFQQEMGATKQRVRDLQASAMTSVARVLEQQTKNKYSSAFVKVYNKCKVDEHISSMIAKRTTFFEIMDSNSPLDDISSWFFDSVAIGLAIFKFMATDYNVWLQQIPNAKAISRFMHILFTQVIQVVKTFFQPVNRNKKFVLPANASATNNFPGESGGAPGFTMTPEMARNVQIRGNMLNDRMARGLMQGGATKGVSGGAWGAGSVVRKAMDMITSGLYKVMNNLSGLIQYVAKMATNAFSFDMQFKFLMNFFTPVKQITFAGGATRAEEDNAKKTAEEEAKVKAIEKAEEADNAVNTHLDNIVNNFLDIPNNGSSNSLLCPNIQQMLYSNVLTQTILSINNKFEFPVDELMAPSVNLMTWTFRFLLDLVYIAMVASISPFITATEGIFKIICAISNLWGAFMKGNIHFSVLWKKLLGKISEQLKLKDETQIKSLAEDLKKDYSTAHTMGELVRIMRRRVDFVSRENEKK